MRRSKMTDKCSRCDGTGLFAKKTWNDPAIPCDDCNGTGSWQVAECLRLIRETNRLIGKSNPQLAREIADALEERVKEGE